MSIKKLGLVIALMSSTLYATTPWTCELEEKDGGWRIKVSPFIGVRNPVCTTITEKLNEAFPNKANAENPEAKWFPGGEWVEHNRMRPNNPRALPCVIIREVTTRNDLLCRDVKKYLIEHFQIKQSTPIGSTPIDSTSTGTLPAPPEEKIEE